MLLDEIDNNFYIFSEDWESELRTINKNLNAYTDIYKDSYRRIVSIQAWRTNLLENIISEESLYFFLEAQNDALISHVQASLGSWRVALKALRSCIENTVLTLYYMDHPIELELWLHSKHKLGFSDAINYLRNHPKFLGKSEAVNGIGIIQKEYAQLSLAVHGSSKQFRMTEDGKAINLWTDDKIALNKWHTRERQSLKGINLILLTMFRDYLTGTAKSGLRECIGLAIPSDRDSLIQSNFGIKIRRQK